MQQKIRTIMYAILFFALLGAGAAFAALFAGGRGGTAEDWYVAGIVACVILLVFVLLTKLMPALRNKNTENRMQKLRASAAEYQSFDAASLKEALPAALQKSGFALTNTEVAQSGGEAMRLTIAQKHSFHFIFGHIDRFVIITEDFRKARDFDTIKKHAAGLTVSDVPPDKPAPRRCACAAAVLLMPHVPDQIRSTCRDEAVTAGPAYIPVACDLSAGKAYYLGGKSLTLTEFRLTQRMIKKYVLEKEKKTKS